MKITTQVTDAYLKKMRLERELEDLHSRVITAEGDYERASELLNNGVVHSGAREYDDYESGYNWFIFKPTMTDAEISSACDRLGIPVGGDRDRGVFDDNDWDCSGKTLVDPAHIKRTKTRVLVTQHWYVDV
jgi:hypothetical protein|tara:strand:+ start:230 stop:622 length:393 start_codon:yes stop_codon:yes gene_type:complete